LLREFREFDPQEIDGNYLMYNVSPEQLYKYEQDLAQHQHMRQHSEHQDVDELIRKYEVLSPIEEENA